MGVTASVKGVAVDNILKRARVCCGQSSPASVARTMLKRARRREQRADGGGGREVAEGRRGLYVKGGRARCYLACSPDEISG